VAVLSHALWQGQFGGDRDVIGRTVQLDGDPHEIVGVMPAGFETVSEGTDLWLPLALDPAEWYHTNSVLLAVGRLAPGATVASAAREVPALARGLREAFAYPADYGQSATIVGLRDQIVGSVRPALLVVTGAVGFILLIACANVASLLLARAAGRTREAAIRASLGAGGRRLLRQTLTEGLVLASAGGALGLVLATVVMAVLTSRLPSEMPRLDAIQINPVVLGAVALMTLASAIVFGVAPAWVTARSDLHALLRGATLAGGSPTGRRLRGTLVTVETALALVLVLGAGLMLRTLWSLTQVDPGFRSQGVLTLRVQPTGPRYEEPDQILAFYDRLFERVRAFPGVRTVGAVQHLPLTGFSWTTSVQLDGRPLPAGASPPRVAWRIATRDYLAALGIPIRQGRGFLPSDRSGERVVLVNETTARQLWPGESPIGKRINAGNATVRDWATVVGIVGDVRHNAIERAPGPELWVPHDQYTQTAMAVAVNVSGDPLALARSLREAVWAIDPNVPVSQMRTLDAIASTALAQPRLLLTLFGAFAGVGLTLGLVGIYGVVANGVASRTREIGVRVALGASPSGVVSLVLRQGLVTAGLGVAIGLMCAAALAQSMKALVHGVSPFDPLTYTGMSALVLIAATAASYVPARRAARIDPAVTLRQEV
jgi:predicted permease